MNLQISRQILSFRDVSERAVNSEKTVLLLRHSFRESLRNGNLDPDLTDEGKEYARHCGRLLAGMNAPGRTACFGSSPLLRTRRTAECIMQGGGFPDTDIVNYHEIGDYAMFQNREQVIEVQKHPDDIPAMLRRYYGTGSAPGMKNLADYTAELTDFLTDGRLNADNAICLTHDIIVAALLISRNVYPFCPEDWCGYVQGAALFRNHSGEWTMAYAVPETDKRVNTPLFI